MPFSGSAVYSRITVGVPLELMRVKSVYGYCPRDSITTLAILSVDPTISE